MHVRAVKTPVFKEGDDLVAFIVTHIPKLAEGSVLVITSKIVALAEGRTASAKDKEKIIRAESEWTLKTKYVLLTMKDGMMLANAGVDASNADGKLVLLPEDSFVAAKRVRDALRRRFKLKKLAVLITDSRVLPLRSGVVGVALGYAGFRGLRDYRGKKDLFGRTLKFTQTNIADNLASAAVLAMGEGSERKPLAVITDAPVEFTERINPKELSIDPKNDMYVPILRIPKRRKR